MDDTHRQWIDDREIAVWSPHGIASLASTHWLDADERSYDGAPGLWRQEGDTIVGSALPGEVRLAAGEEAQVGDVAVRAHLRDGTLALRVLDPQAATRRGISAIVRAPYDPLLRVPGRFTPTPRSSPTESVDGYRSSTVYDGTVSFRLGGRELELTVTRDHATLFAAFRDATSGTESYPFRFLRPPLPDDDGRVTVDLNRGYLPPCAFSDHYACVFPPPGNRWDVPVLGGELLVR
ncbi:DUF1684 domain-containing protein [Microbacterium sp. CPCC 204701]|uniref:DUF1684 domain-containing protein n=1 Tax=Microbacterium sp. CPCC 204701 TaxID=2493084 RepID=UPI0013E3EEFE|nr:DUF1684 domain-containing protein [Microbacterium sp. CPCC 204701]